jgi:hypothetical protein
MKKFFISLTSKLITYFIDGFTSEWKSKSFAHLLSESEHTCILDSRPWSWGALNMGFVDKVTLKNARDNSFWKSYGAGYAF